MLFDMDTKLRSSWSTYPTPTLETVEALIQADSPQKLKEFIESWSPLFTMGLYHHIDHRVLADEQAYIEARELIVFAVLLRRLIQKRDCTEERLREIGVELLPVDLYEPKTLKKTGVMYELFWQIPIKSNPYYLFLRYCQESVNSSGNENDWLTHVYPDKEIATLAPEEETWLSIDVPFNASKSLEFFCIVFLDALISLHLADFRLASANNTEYKASGSLLSALWFCLLSSFETGRAGRCIVCWKPYIAVGERGISRLFCSESCSKKHQRYKEFEHLISCKHSEKDAAKLAHIKLATALGIRERTERTDSAH